MERRQKREKNKHQKGQTEDKRQDCQQSHQI